MAARSDAMIVIGDRRSSNTKRLAELCRALCPRVVAVEGAEELEPSSFRGLASVGVTAGASTPGWIIKEVYDKMSDENIEIEESFAEMLEKSIKTLNTGEKVTGVVTGITPTEIYVDLGTKHAGYIPVSELTDDPTAKVEDLVKIGDEIETYVMRVNDQEGVVTLSKKRLDTVKSWDDIEQAREEHTTVEGVVTEENKGGVVVSIKGVRVFVPASQTGLPRETPMSQLLKQHVRLRITEVNRARRRVVGSIRAVEAEERAAKAAKVWEEIEESKRYTGVVKSLTSYGAFVDLGGVDGMIHISELSWSRIKHPSEVVNVGDTVDVYIRDLDTEKKKISLGYRKAEDNPWEIFKANYPIGSVVDAKIVGMTTFGAFAQIIPGIDGLIHISQIADRRIEKPQDELKIGQEVKVKITNVDYDSKRISLSIRALLEDGQQGGYAHHGEGVELGQPGHGDGGEARPGGYAGVQGVVGAGDQQEAHHAGDGAGQARALSGLEQYHGDQENRGRHVHNAQNQLGDIHAASSFRPRMGHHSSIRYGLWAQLSRAAFKRGFYRSTFPRRFQAFFRISQPPRTIRRLPQQVARK